MLRPWVRASLVAYFYQNGCRKARNTKDGPNENRFKKFRPHYKMIVRSQLLKVLWLSSLTLAIGWFLEGSRTVWRLWVKKCLSLSRSPDWKNRIWFPLHSMITATMAQSAAPKSYNPKVVSSSLTGYRLLSKWMSQKLGKRNLVHTRTDLWNSYAITTRLSEVNSWRFFGWAASLLQ